VPRVFIFILYPHIISAKNKIGRLSSKRLFTAAYRYVLRLFSGIRFQKTSADIFAVLCEKNALTITGGAPRKSGNGL
jgi:hypothetical protein